MKNSAPASILASALITASAAHAQSVTVASHLPREVHLLPTTLETTQWDLPILT